MKVFGYQKDSEDLIELVEVSFQSSIAELEKMIKFLQETKEQHNKVVNETEFCHSHFRDWDDDWKEGSVDIIITTASYS